MEENGEHAAYRYRVDNDGGAVVTRCVAKATVLKVPSQLGGHPVVALGDESFAASASWGVEGDALAAGGASGAPGAVPFKGGGFGGRFMKLANDQLERVELPQGLERIGRAAFRGCTRLAAVTLPDSLVEIGDLAFSCTSVGAIRLPWACVRLSDLALRTGPESLAGPASPYYSKLDAIEVDPGNPAYAMSGGALCRRLAQGGLEAIACPGRVRELRLAHAVARVAPTAFAGTYEIGTLAFPEALELAGGCGLAVNASCERVEIELKGAAAGAPADELAGAAGGADGRAPGTPSRPLALAMPSRELQRRVFASTEGMEAFDLPAFLVAYDAAIAEEPDRLLQSKLMLARLARPLHLGDPARAAFTCTLEPLFDTLCVHLGARNDWQAFQDMADAGLLDAESIPRAIAVLTARADTTAAAYLLELKRERFRESGWDYGL